VPIKTRHNEVAPSQFELAPIFEHVVLATDHNMLTMEIAQELAQRHGLHCILAEKPFAGVNGSGKHMNWSMADDQGTNLLEPGNTPHDNLKFMLFLTAIVRAVDRYQDLLRSSVATPGNDHRLGANEAPPAIMSIFVGSQLEEVIRGLIEGRAPDTKAGGQLRLGVNTLPPLPRDISDRNRTSPFAFTGNKFEFRAVGASQSIAYPATILNTMVAESLDFIATEIEKRSGPGDRRDSIQQLVREMLTRHQRILFSGDNYTADWVTEAEKRGLYNLKDTPSAVARFAAQPNVDLFERYAVLSPREAESRANVLNLKYVHQLGVEAKSMIDIASTMLLAAATRFQTVVAESINAVRSAAPQSDVEPQRLHLKRVTDGLNRLTQEIGGLHRALEKAEQTTGTTNDVARSFRDDVVPAMVALRTTADRLEELVEDELWPLPTYRELLFLH
jgi:glutamine synthetase